MEYDYLENDEHYYSRNHSNYSEYFDYDYGPYEYYSVYFPHKYKLKADWEIPIRGPLTFIIAIMTVITNALLISVFVFRSTRSPTTIILTSLAVSNSVICFSQLPDAIYFNMAGNSNNPYMKYGWCVTNHVFFIIYSVFRMTSNWLTVLLGLQRLLAVCTPFYYSRVCNPKTTMITIASILLTAMLVYLYEAFGIEIKELPIYTTHFKNETLPSGCTRAISQSLINIVGDIKRSMMVYYIFSGVLTRLLPIIVLLITTVFLVLLLHARIVSLKTSFSFKKEQLKRINKLVITILIVFLVAEIQDGIAFLIYAHELATDQKGKILSEEDDILWDTISSTLSLLSYDCIFWIFFLMSAQFRKALLDILQCQSKRLRGILNLESTDGKTNSSFSNMTSRDERSTVI